MSQTLKQKRVLMTDHQQQQRRRFIHDYIDRNMHPQSDYYELFKGAIVVAWLVAICWLALWVVA